MYTSIVPIQGENIKVQNNRSTSCPKVKLTLPPDEFVKSSIANNGEKICCKLVDDVRNSNNENKMVDTLYQEYVSIKREDFESDADYRTAKAEAYARWKDAAELADKNAEGRGNTNANIFEKVWGSFCDGIQKAGDKILGFFSFFAPKQA